MGSEKKKKRKRGTLNEEDTTSLLQRYNATTILALLQEVSQFASMKIDWNALVKRTCTGIKSAREYQMLWRHLAYRDTLLDKLQDGAEPLDDDSDVEFVVEAVPSISAEASLEAAACVKRGGKVQNTHTQMISCKSSKPQEVLISSGVQRETGPTSRLTVEDPLTINIPNEQTPAPLDQQQPAHPHGVDATVPVSNQKNQKDSLQAGPLIDHDENGLPGSGLPSKKRRNPWAREEDIALTAAVEKYGEGNWTIILKADILHNRSASQLSQRWSIIRKRHPNSKAGGANKSSSSTRSEERLAAQKAMLLAIDMPMTRIGPTIFPGGTQSSNQAEAQPASAPQAPNQASTPVTSLRGTSNPPNKLRMVKKQTAPMMPLPPPAAAPTPCLNSSIQAVAFAAGGRIAAPSTKASFLKAAQSKSAVHIPVGGAWIPPGTQARSVLKPPPQNSGPLPLRAGGQQLRGCAGRTPITSLAASVGSSQLTQSETKMDLDRPISQYPIHAVNKAEVGSTGAGRVQVMATDAGRMQITAGISSERQGADNAGDPKGNAAGEQLDRIELSAQ